MVNPQIRKEDSFLLLIHGRTEKQEGISTDSNSQGAIHQMQWSSHIESCNVPFVWEKATMNRWN